MPITSPPSLIIEIKPLFKELVNSTEVVFEQVKANSEEAMPLTSPPSLIIETKPLFKELVDSTEVVFEQVKANSSLSSSSLEFNYKPLNGSLMRISSLNYSDEVNLN